MYKHTTHCEGQTLVLFYILKSRLPLFGIFSHANQEFLVRTTNVAFYPIKCDGENFQQQVVFNQIEIKMTA